MKRLFLTLIAIAALIFSSCSNKVDLYSYDGDKTIVYAMLDAGVDTNFFKITHSFIGDVSQLAHNYDANNYNYDDLEVTFSGIFDGSTQTQTVTLDTISKWIPYDENAQFYSGCRQTYYYTTKKLLEGKEYTLNILRKEDNVNISAKTKTINSFRYRKPIPNAILNFNIKKFTLEWFVEDPNTMYKSTAAYFEIVGYFHYKELMPGSTDTVSQTIRWPLGSDKADNLFSSNSTPPYYTITYTPDALYDILAINQHLRECSPIGVKRFYEDFELEISGMGEELYDYYIITNSTSAIQDVPNYSNIDNGIGIMSSRISKSSFHRINQLSRKRIEDDFPQYGFVNDPNP